MGHGRVGEVRNANLVTVNKRKSAVFAGWKVWKLGFCSLRALGTNAYSFDVFLLRNCS